jgi:hypothetical protein
MARTAESGSSPPGVTRRRLTTRYRDEGVTGSAGRQLLVLTVSPLTTDGDSL